MHFRLLLLPHGEGVLFPPQLAVVVASSEAGGARALNFGIFFQVILVARNVADICSLFFQLEAQQKKE